MMKHQPRLDPDFFPAVLWNRSYAAKVAKTPGSKPLAISLERGDSKVSVYRTNVLPQTEENSALNIRYVERLLKFLLWQRGGYKVLIAGEPVIAAMIKAIYSPVGARAFDYDFMGRKVYGHPMEVEACDLDAVPEPRELSIPLGRNLDGCRIGFDLGGSDRKVAAVIDGKVVFSEETTWDPYFQPDPQYHYDGIMDSLKKAAAHLPRVDAIGGSAAGVYVNNRVKVASLFRGVPVEVFNNRVRDLFLEIRKAWNNIPLDVVNDGEVTALAGSMSLGKNSILGISLGTSTAGGYVNAEGNITTWLNELAFVPVDYNPQAPTDEWSGDYGCGVQYFSQQCVGRLLAPAGIEADPKLPLPEKLKQVQKLMDQEDGRARKIYQTIGTYLGYTIAHFSDFYDLENVLILGRVTSGPGGDIIIAGAKEVLKVEFPELTGKIAFHIPDEKDKRHGQAVAAASLPTITRK